MKQKHFFLSLGAIIFLVIAAAFARVGVKNVAATAVSDDFNRTNLGSNWQVLYGAPGIVDGNDLGIISGTGGGVQWILNTSSADQFSEAVVSASENPNVMAQVFVRRRSTDNARYTFTWNSSLTPPQWELKFNGGTASLIKTLGVAAAPTSIAGGLMRIEAVNTTINAYFNSNLVLSAQDGAIANGEIGVAFRLKPNSTVLLPSPVFASWNGGDLNNAPPPPPPSDSTKIPLNVMALNQTYFGFSGGLYENTTNVPPGDHDAAGQNATQSVVPLDVNGNPISSGKILLMSLGMSNTTQEWCGQFKITDWQKSKGPCTSWSFRGQLSNVSNLNKTFLAVLNGALGNQVANAWDQAYGPDPNIEPNAGFTNNYDRVRDYVLTPWGLTEKQVQILWIKVADLSPSRQGLPTLPDPNADAYLLEKEMGDISRAAKQRYPNLKEIFFSSRTYAGYATTLLNPEPYAYESGFAVKWLIQAQIDQMRNGGTVVDQRAGDLNYNNGVAPWLVWGPYLWADGTNPGANGLTWVKSEFESDGTHPSPPGAPSNKQSGEYKVGNLLLNFFLTSPYTSWFRSP